MPILKTVEDQVVFNFTGKVNLLTAQSGKFIGSIFLKDGLIVNSFYGKYESENALYCIILRDYLDEKNCRYIVEPEIISSYNQSFSLSLDQVKREWPLFKKLYDEADALRPNGQLKIIIAPSFIEKGEELGPCEYTTLKIITDYSLVEDIYRYTELPSFLTTISLVSLRKKGALKVCQNT